MHISTKCSIAIHCLIFISEYGETQKVTSELLSLSTGSNPVTIRNIVSALKKEGILSVRFGTGGTTLSCPLEEITLYRICSAIEPDFLGKLIGIHTMPSPLCPVGKNIHSILDVSYEKIRKDLQGSLQNISMKDIVDKYHDL
ncbi:MAG: Rrf2 family transcriptional regulator [Lachnospiraceae bacterium]|nr:Rrf2 family transcriptional regulator [Lachnospiraceae bacterium]MDE7200675.1 Rrf2 family transcriptional regulator [Lachnospiraceae bacterium]